MYIFLAKIIAVSTFSHLCLTLFLANITRGSFISPKNTDVFFRKKSPVYIFAHVFFLRKNTGVSADPLRGGQTRPGESEEPPHPLAELTAERRHGNLESSHILTLILHNIQ